MQKKRGISLIVLVITIIVMIILAATIIISINNANVMEKANEAVAGTDFATVKELANLAWGEAYASGERTVEDPDTTGPKIGLEQSVLNNLEANNVDLDKYTVMVTKKGVIVSLGWLQDGTKVKKGRNTYEVGQKALVNNGELPSGYAWYILGAEDGKLLVSTYREAIEDYQIKGVDETWKIKDNGDYTQSGDWGYTTAVAKLNKACQDLLEGKGGSKVESIRSIKVEDLNRVLGYDPVTYHDSSYGILVDSEKTYPDGTTSIGKIKQNSYAYLSKDIVPEVTTEADSFIFGRVGFTNSYWLASSYVDSSYGIDFGLFVVLDYYNVDLAPLWHSNNNSTGYDTDSYGVRPVLCLAQDYVPSLQQ